MQLNTVYFICKLLYMFRVVSPPIISSTNNCIYSIWYWSTVVAICRYCGGVETYCCYMSLSWGSSDLLLLPVALWGSSDLLLLPVALWGS